MLISRSRTWGTLAAAAVAGAATMTVELGAVRLMAPWFGTSAGVWTNVIGVILLALALGYLLGARLAMRARPQRSLGLVLLASAAFTIWLPSLAHPVCGWFLPDGLSLHQAAGLWLWGSLAASLMLFLPSAILLGCVGPLALEVVQRSSGGHAGTAGGQVLCVSTLGSLVGTFATTHLFLPELGIARTLQLAALALLVVGALVLLAERRAIPVLEQASQAGGRPPARGGPAGGAVVVLLIGTAVAGAAVGGRVTQPKLAEGLEVLASAESPYQSLRVVEDRRWAAPFRMLQVNEGLDSYQSVWQPEQGLLGPGFYYDYFALPAGWDRRAAGPWRTLVLGLGAGTAFRVLRGATPATRELDLWGVEIDDEVVRLGREFFDLEGDGERVHVISGQDARTALGQLPRDFALICLDAYANQVEIPPHLCTTEFFTQLSDHLSPGGWIAINVGGFGAQDPVVEAIGFTLAHALAGQSSQRAVGPPGPSELREPPDPSAPRVLAVRVAASRNWMIFGRKQAACPLPGDAAWPIEGPVGAALLPALELPGAVRVFRPDPSRMLLTDDRSPMTRLERLSLERGRAALAQR